MAQSQEQNLFDQHGHINYDKVVEHVHKKLITFLTSSLSESFSSANEAKFRKQFVEIDRNTRNEAFRALISSQHVVSSEFHAEFESNFYISSTSITRSKFNSSQLHAIETDLIELTLAVDNLIKKAEDNNKLSLEVLRLRMQELSYYALVEFNINCLSPSVFLPLFQNSVFPLKISIEGKIFLCKVISQFIIPNLSAFYAETNEFLIQMEILPAAKDLELEKSPELNTPNSENENASGLHMSTGQFFAFIEHESNKQQNLQSNIVSNLSLEKELQASNTKQASETSADNYAPGKSGLDQNTIGIVLQPYNSNIRNDSSPGQRREFVRALSTVQRVEFSKNAIFKPDQIKTAIRRTLHEKGALDAEIIVQNEEEIIDFVSKIFKVILDDETLSPQIKNLLSKLQISIIKLALVDFTFFQNPKHPARILLNKLTSIGMEVDDGKGVLYVRLKSIINLVSENFVTDVQIFELALSEVNRLESLNLDEIQAEIERNKRGLTSNNRRTAAKRTVIHTIKKYLNGRSLPNVMLEFCLKCWAPHMAIIFIEHGKKSKQWRKSVRTLRRVIEVSQAVHTIQQVEQYIPDPYEFFDYIGKELEYLSSESIEFEEIIEAAEFWYASFINEIDPEEDVEPEREREQEPEDKISNTGKNEESMIDVFKNISNANTSSVSSTLIQTRDDLEKYVAQKNKQENKEKTKNEKCDEASSTINLAEENSPTNRTSHNRTTEVELIKNKKNTEIDNNNSQPVTNHQKQAEPSSDVSKPVINKQKSTKPKNQEPQPAANAQKTQEPESTNDISVPKVKLQENIDPVKRVEEVEEIITLDSLPKNIVPGAWLEIYQGEEKAKRRLKFSSSNTVTETLLFTDRSGDYRLEIDVNTFMHDLNSGRSRLMVESNLFDVALSSVISNIRGEQDKFKDLI